MVVVGFPARGFNPLEQARGGEATELSERLRDRSEVHTAQPTEANSVIPDDGNIARDIQTCLFHCGNRTHRRKVVGHKKSGGG